MLSVALRWATTAISAGAEAGVAQKGTATGAASAYGFRYDPMEFVNESDALQAALMRKSVFGSATAEDAGLIQAAIDTILDGQFPDGTLSDDSRSRAAVAGTAVRGHGGQAGLGGRRKLARLRYPFTGPVRRYADRHQSYRRIPITHTPPRPRRIERLCLRRGCQRRDRRSLFPGIEGKAGCPSRHQRQRSTAARGGSGCT